MKRDEEEKKRGMFLTVSFLLPKEYEEEQEVKKWCMLLGENSLPTKEYEKEEDKKLDVLQRRLLDKKGIQ